MPDNDLLKPKVTCGGVIRTSDLCGAMSVVLHSLSTSLGAGSGESEPSLQSHSASSLAG